MNWEGLYEVSDEGSVRSLPRQTTRGLLGGRTLKTAPGANRYPRVTLSNGPRRRDELVHVLVMAAFVGPCPAGMEIRHLNGNRLDARLANLAYGTHAENQQDAVRHGVHGQASKTHCAQNHAFDAANTYRNPTSGRRACRECTREWTRQRKARRVAASANG